MTSLSTPAKIMADYRQSLILALRMKDVPGDRIGEIVAEVESHVADTEEDPSEAFGPAKVYAAKVAADRPRASRRATVLLVLLAGVAGWLVSAGALNVLLGENYLGQPGWVSLLVGLLVGIPGAIIVQRCSTRVRDPRTGADMVPSSPWGMAALVGVPFAIILVAWGAIELAN